MVILRYELLALTYETVRAELVLHSGFLLKITARVYYFINLFSEIQKGIKECALHELRMEILLARVHLKTLCPYQLSSKMVTSKKWSFFSQILGFILCQKEPTSKKMALMDMVFGAQTDLY